MHLPIKTNQQQQQKEACYSLYGMRKDLKKVFKSSAPCLSKELKVAMAVKGHLGDEKLEKVLGASGRYE